jgi:hypothetical protein
MNKTFQVLIPFDSDRGGAESLYQLVYFLKKFNTKVSIVYTLNWRGFFKKKKTLIPESMEKYCKDVQIKNFLKDEEDNIIFVPEIFTSYVRNLKYSKINICWLSVNNYFVGKTKFNENFKWIIRGKYGVGRIMHPHFKQPLNINEINGKDVNHIAQSIYAEKFIKSNFGKKPIPIYDFIDDIPKIDKSFFNLSLRSKSIIYNPAKGYKITKKLIKKYKSQYNFIPIQNMKHKEVRELLKNSFLYIDFGEHPGKDRIPREAILCGCCLITGYRGSAAFKDLPIDKKFKLFEDENFEKNFEKLILELETKIDCRSFFLDAYNMLLQDKEKVSNQVENYIKSL